MRTRTAIAVTAGLLLAITGCETDDTDAGSPPAASKAPASKGSEAKASADPANDSSFGTFPGASLDSWTKAMAGHGIKWTKKDEPGTVPGVKTRDWFGESAGALSAPTFTASAITTPAGKIMSISCNAAAIPKGGGQELAVLTDCVTAAGAEGLDKNTAQKWISDNLPSMLAKGDLQVEETTLGPLHLTMDATGDTAAVELSPGD